MKAESKKPPPQKQTTSGEMEEPLKKECQEGMRSDTRELGIFGKLLLPAETTNNGFAGDLF